MDDLRGIRRRPTLPGRFQPSTISVLRLNFCVRDGNRWIPQAIVTGNSQCECLLLPPFWYRRFGNPTASRLPSSSLAFAICAPLSLRAIRTLKTAQAGAPSAPDLGASFAPSKLLSRFPQISGFSDQALDRLVSSSSIHCCTSTDDLSTLSSSRGLTHFRDGNSFLQGGFTLRCLQRLSRPHFASQLCRWHDNCCTRGASIPVLSY